MNVRFFNTFDTAAPFFRTLLPHLAGRGHGVEAVLARQQYRPGGLTAVDGEYRIRQVRTFAPSFAGGRGRKASIAASYALAAAAVSLPSRWADVNVFLTQPPLFHAWGRVVGKLHRQPYCVVAMDLYPWVAVEAGLLARGGWKARLAGSLAVGAMRRAARVFAIGRCMVERLQGWGIPDRRIRWIPNWVDTGVVRPVPAAENRLRRELGLDGRFVVMYSGNLGISHRFDDLLEVAHRLRGLPELVFLFVGGGPRLPEVRRRVEELGLDQVRFLGYQDYERLSESLSLGDVHFVSLRNGFEGLVVPSKAYGVLAAGRPILYQGSPRGEIARLVTESGTGAVVEEGRVGDLEAAVLRAHRDRAWRREAGERARRLAEERYGSRRAAEAYAEALEELAGTGEGAP